MDNIEILLFKCIFRHKTGARSSKFSENLIQAEPERFVSYKKTVHLKTQKNYYYIKALAKITLKRKQCIITRRNAIRNIHI